MTPDDGRSGRRNLIPGGRSGGPLPSLPPEPVEQLRELFAKQLYAILRQPVCLTRFRKLLRAKNEKTALEAWRLAFEHGWPVEKAPQQAKTLVQINNKIARPAKIVVDGAVVNE